MPVSGTGLSKGSKEEARRDNKLTTKMILDCCLRNCCEEFFASVSHVTVFCVGVQWLLSCYPQSPLLYPRDIDDITIWDPLEKFYLQLSPHHQLEPGPVNVAGSVSGHYSATTT